MGEEQYGIRNDLGVPLATTRLAGQAIVCMPPRVAQFTLPEWKANNDARCRVAEDQRQLADRILGESQKVRDQTQEQAELLKATSEHRIEERIGQIEFNKGELQLQRNEIYQELEALGVYKTRLQDCLASLQGNSLTICLKCLQLRDGRTGIDMTVDEVEKALQDEITTITGSQPLLIRALEQSNEQMRRLRASRYLLDRDLQYKQGAIDIDISSLNLKPKSPNLSIYEGFASLDVANISAEEYNAMSAKSIRDAAREVTSGRQIRMYIDTLLKQVTYDLRTAYKHCNHEFTQRIKESKNAKALLEEMHKLTTEKIIAMQNDILKLKKALADKEGFIGLAHTRLGKRAQRVAAELVRDPGGQSLYYECEMLRHSTEQLQQMLHEVTSSLRYMLQTQIQLEEEINVKMNTIKIDEVDCMTMRLGLEYYTY